MKDILIKKSNIHGKGVFANRNFKKGEKIIDWKDCSKLLTKKEFDGLPETEKIFVSEIRKGEFRLLFPPARFVNYSCDFNTNVMDNSDTAIRDIKKGEEITADYVSENAKGPIIKCNCGSSKCKGTILE